MKGLIWIIILFAAAVGGALLIQHFPGDVYAHVGSYMIRMNVRLFVVGLIIAMIVLHFLLKFIFGVLATPGKMSRFGSSRKSRKALESLNEAGVAFFEGRYQKAASEAAKVLSNQHAGDNRVLALMIAAQANHRIGEQGKRDGYLKDMETHLPAKAQLPRYLLQAESAMARKDYVSAEESLTAAAQLDKNLPEVLGLQLRLAVAKNHPLEILETVDKLQKGSHLAMEEVLSYRSMAYRRLVENAANAQALKNDALSRIPNEVKSGDLCVAIAEKYAALGLHQEAAAWVRSYYPHTHHVDLLPVFANSVRYLNDAEQRKAIDIADGWLKTKPDDAELLSCLGDLAITKQLWGKAQNYLEASIRIKPTAHARLALAKVFDETQAVGAADEQRRLVLGEMAQ